MGIPGNVIVVLREEKHPVFRREGNNLFIKKKISLKESICGFKFMFSHLDDRRFLVTSEPGKIYSHGDIKCLPDEGLMDTLAGEIFMLNLKLSLWLLTISLKKKKDD